MKNILSVFLLFVYIQSNIELKGQIPTSGLIGFYPFSGNSNDQSGNGNNAINNGAILTTDRCGRSNSAYYFNGVSDYIYLGSNQKFTPDYTTISCWFNTTNSTMPMALVRWRSYGYGLAFNNPNDPSSNGLYFNCYTSSSTCYTLKNNVNYSDGMWHLAVFAFDGKTAKLYIDNKLIASDNKYPDSPIYYASGALAFGRDGDNPSFFFQGKLDDIGIYNRALTETEIASLYDLNCKPWITGSNIVCQGDQNINYRVNNIDNRISYSWSYNGKGITLSEIDNEANVNFSKDATSGELKVIGYDAYGNKDSAILGITVNVLPSAAGIITGSKEVCRKSTGIKYFIPLVNEAIQYNWFYSGTGALITGNSQSVSVDFSQNATSGNLTVSGENNCGYGGMSQPFSIIVDSCNIPENDEFNIPNSFSPNGDGINDLFIIRGLKPNTKLIIFDRAGEKIYHSDNYNNDWNGESDNGKKQRTNTYWYVVITPGFQTEFKGFVYLKR